MENRVSFYQKLFAKVLDFTLLYTTLCLSALAWPFSIEDAVYLYMLLLCPFIWVPLEVIFLLSWGTTPGGAFLGISPQTAGGKPLGFAKALRLSLFLEKKNSIRWVRASKPLGRFLARMAMGAVVLVGFIFGKAVFQFPEEFERTFGQQEWVHYKSPEDNFTADFPAEPTVNEKHLPIPQAKKTLDYSEYRLDHTDKVSYSISVLELPRKWRIFGSSTILKGALSVILDNISAAKLVSKKLVHHGEHPAMEFHIRENDKEIKGRLILVGGNLYKVEYSQEFDTAAEEEGIAFIQSFSPTP